MRFRNVRESMKKFIILAPPSYEECISGSNNIADQNEQGMHGANVQFSPRYPVYKFPMPTPCK